MYNEFNSFVVDLEDEDWSTEEDKENLHVRSMEMLKITNKYITAINYKILNSYAQADPDPTASAVSVVAATTEQLVSSSSSLDAYSALVASEASVMVDIKADIDQEDIRVISWSKPSPTSQSSELVSKCQVPGGQCCHCSCV